MGVKEWLNKAFSEADGLPSSRRILFALVVVFSLGVVVASLAIQRELIEQAKSIIETLIWATAATLGVGKFAEK